MNSVMGLPEVLVGRVLSLIYFGEDYSCECLVCQFCNDLLLKTFLNREKMPVHKVGSTPLDMNQFRMLFSTCKVPGVNRDYIMNYFKTGK